MSTLIKALRPNYHCILKQLFMSVMNCSRSNEIVLAVREEEDRQSAHPPTHSPDRLGVMTGAAAAAAAWPLIRRSRQRNRTLTEVSL